MTTVLLVEDDTPTRDWLQGLLRAEAEVDDIHPCGCVADALAWLASDQPVDLVLTDLGLPDGTGLQVIRAAVRKPGCDVLVLSIFGDEANVLSAIEAGASGYLLKDGSLESMREPLRCLKSGGSPLSPRIARTLIRRTQATQLAAPSPQAPAPQGALLSEREAEVLAGIGKGFSYQEVADALGISTNTVRTHVRRIYEKLAVNSRVEALYEYNRRMAEQGLPPIR